VAHHAGALDSVAFEQGRRDSRSGDRNPIHMGGADPARWRSFLEEGAGQLALLAEFKSAPGSCYELIRHISAFCGSKARLAIQDRRRPFPLYPGRRPWSRQASMLFGTEGDRPHALLSQLLLQDPIPIVPPVIAASLAEQAGADQDLLEGNFRGIRRHDPILVPPVAVTASSGAQRHLTANRARSYPLAPSVARLVTAVGRRGSPRVPKSPFHPPPEFRPMRPVQVLFLPLVLVLLPSLQADTIHLTDGTSIEEVKVKDETLQSVTYKEGREETLVQSNRILSITFSPMPTLIDRAEAGLDEDQYMGAVMGYEEYIAQNSEPERKYPWALPYAYYRVVELQQTMREWDAVVVAVDRLLLKAGTSRYAPLALIKKAEALYDGGKPKQAMAALDELTQLSKSAQLGGRWDIEADLRRLLFDTRLKGQERVKKLEALSSRAGGTYRSAWGRAEVAIGESLLKDNDQAGAEKVFRAVIKDSGSDRYARAAAWSGVGACLFNRAAAATEAGEDGAAAICRESALAHMRVLVLYRDQTRFLSGALYWAGRSFDLIGDEESADRAQRLYRKVIRNHKGTRWAEEARAFYKKR